MKIMNHIKKFFLLLSAIMIVSISANKANATNCDALYEVIITLKEPRFGVPSVWDAPYEQEAYMVQASAGLPSDEGTVFIVGEKLSLDDYKPKETFLVRLNRRGRALFEKSYPAKLNERSIDVILNDDHYVVGSNFSLTKSQRAVKLSWYNAQGKKTSDKILKDNDFNYEITDLHHGINGGLIVVIHASHVVNSEDEYGLIINLSNKGSELWRRAYRPGIPNRINSVSTEKNRGHYLASGRIRLDDGRMAGWILELNFDGTVVWQRTYPRGDASNLIYGTSREGNYYFVGEADPIDDGNRAAWVIALSNLGEPLWQRYYRGNNHNFSAVGILDHDDGRISVALNAEAALGSIKKTHVRLLTLDPRGTIVMDEPYLRGLEAKGSQFLFGANQERIVISNSRVDPNPEPEDKGFAERFFGNATNSETNTVDASEQTKVPSDDTLNDYEGWVLVATPLDPFKDVCK
jgi:hypothetical protein